MAQKIIIQSVTVTIFHFLCRHEMENYKQNQVKIIKLYHIGIYNNQSQIFLVLTIYLNGKNYDSQKKKNREVIPPLNIDGTFPSR